MMVSKWDLLFQGPFSGSMLNFRGVLVRVTQKLPESVSVKLGILNVKPHPNGLWQELYHSSWDWCTWGVYIYIYIRVGRWWIGTMIRLMDKIWRTSSYGWISARHVWSVRQKWLFASQSVRYAYIYYVYIYIYIYHLVVIQLVVYVDGLPLLESLMTSGRLVGICSNLTIGKKSLAKGAWSGLVKLEIVHLISNSHS